MQGVDRHVFLRKNLKSLGCDRDRVGAGLQRRNVVVARGRSQSRRCDTGANVCRGYIGAGNHSAGGIRDRTLDGAVATGLCRGLHSRPSQADCQPE